MGCKPDLASHLREVPVYSLKHDHWALCHIFLYTRFANDVVKWTIILSFLKLLCKTHYCFLVCRTLSVDNKCKVRTFANVTVLKITQRECSFHSWSACTGGTNAMGVSSYPLQNKHEVCRSIPMRVIKYTSITKSLFLVGLADWMTKLCHPSNVINREWGSNC